MNAVSVVISTRNRSALLPEALDAALRQTFDDYEVIVVDNHSTDSTPAVARAYADHSRGKLRYLREEREGVSHGRNCGIAASTGQFIAFTDDDVRVAPQWLSVGMQMLQEDRALAYVGGPVLPIWPVEPPEWLTREHWSPLAAVEYGPRRFIVPTDRAVCLITANLLIRRNALNAVGWFAPDFPRCQDHELMLRLWKARFVGAYHPGMVTYTTVLPARLERGYHRRWHAT